MRRRHIALLSIAFVMGCNAQPLDDEGIMPATTPSPITNPQDLVIKAVGVTSAAVGHTMPECADFALSLDEVKEFFYQAKQVTHSAYVHTLDWSPCLVEGTLKLPNGESAQWVIQQFRAGSVLLKSGESIYLYCPQCRGKAFPPAE